MKIAEEIRKTATDSPLTGGLGCDTDTDGCIHVTGPVLEYVINAKLRPIKYALQLAVLSQGWGANDPHEDRWTEFYSAAKDALAMLEEE